MRLLVWLWLLAAVVGADPLQLDFDKVTVRLYPQQLEWDEGKTHVIHDFAGLRSFFNGEEVPLYAVLGGRDQEFQNRLGLRQVLSAANVSEPSFAVPQMEHLFSLRDPAAKTKLTFAPLKVSSGKSVLLEVSADGFALDPATARLYERFLRYYVGGHPEALAWLTRQKRVPRVLTMTQINMKDKRVTRLVLKSHSVPPAQASPVAVAATASRLDRLIGKTAGLTLPADYALPEARQLLSEKQYLRSALRFFDNMLSLGGGMAPEFKNNQPAFMSDPDSKGVFQALQSSDVKALKALEKPAGDLAYILKVFQAGVLMESDPKASLALYEQAVEAQPTLAGAWRDMGQLYYLSYDAESAWRCWAVARRLAPGHHLLEEVTGLEEQLRKAHPEYF